MTIIMNNSLSVIYSRSSASACAGWFLCDTSGSSIDTSAWFTETVDSIETSFNQRLPPVLQEEIGSNIYTTTTGAAHNYKPWNATLQNGLYKKSPGHWKVAYNHDTIRKLQMKPQRKALTMGNQSSEMKAQYTASDGVSFDTRFSANFQTFLHPTTDQPQKARVKTKDRSQMQMKVKDRGVLSYHGDMYLTTTSKDHRPFTCVEKGKYPKKEYATYWECEGYPKVWGHGSLHNPLPPDSVPREKGPMRDSIWFKSATARPESWNTMSPVKHKGMESEMRSNFKDISREKRFELFQPSVSCPYDVQSGGGEVIEHVPKMYTTEYQTIGSAHMVSL